MALPNSSLGRRSRDVNLSDVITLSLSGLLNAQDSATACERYIQTADQLEHLDLEPRILERVSPDLLKHKSNSEAAASEVVAWVLVGREARETDRTGEGDA
ncbi:hypothetical protein FIBSPDRAFT_944028 [Athelia psychrophila]|uniref:Uncharacterized protein n=1 Tax=Athelia psychrophila TaxID=1759441 RepID=A0A166V905_9AGAM|nr:hypothetical protein FIBSPDRAFT_944028 [Fibularhizoctonia sp. CBS 109695]